LSYRGGATPPGRQTSWRPDFNPSSVPSPPCLAIILVDSPNPHFESTWIFEKSAPTTPGCSLSVILFVFSLPSGFLLFCEMCSVKFRQFRFFTVLSFQARRFASSSFVLGGTFPARFPTRARFVFFAPLNGPDFCGPWLTALKALVFLRTLERANFVFLPQT